MKKIAAKSQRASKEVSSVQPRARRLMREALIYWRRYERVEREQRKKAEKEATEQNKLNQEMMEVWFVNVEPPSNRCVDQMCSLGLFSEVEIISSLFREQGS